MFFSVETTSPPGYFLPEEIAAGRTRCKDLVFRYSIPRSAEPLAVFDAMFHAVSYAHRRLGGELLDGTGEPLEEQEFRSEVKGVVEQLKGAGFPPGADATLCVF
jgi:cell division protein ZipA